MRKQSLLLTLAVACGTISSCVRDHNLVNPNTTGQEKVFIVDEGSFGTGNVSLGLYLPKTDSSYQDVFLAANGFSLGDIFQNMAKVNNHYLLAVNNSNKVVITDTNF